MGLIKRFNLCYLVIVMLMSLVFTIELSNGYKFYVGGRDGWVLKPSEDYSHWSNLNRFQVNDTLYFKYTKGKDSVLEVNEEEYKTCNNTTHPITSLSEGDSVFVLSRSGPFFFVSGNSQNCLKGQNLAIKVMSIDHSHTPHHTSPSPSPTLTSPTPSPGADASDSDVLGPAPGPAPASNVVVPELFL
ncbi:unnamed protein product [Cochlearia groenlandica]